MIFTFSSFVLDENNVSLTKDNQPIDVEPKVFKLLCFLCKNPQRAISRDELIAEVWQGRIVSNAAINRAISELRKVIEVDIKNPQFVTTVSKIGYKFEVDVKTTLPVSSQNISVEVKTKTTNKKRYNQNNKTLIFIVIIILVITFLLSESFLFNNENKITISVQTPLTNLKGSAFKQQVYKNGEALFLHRDDKNNNVQIWLKNKNLSAQKLTSDSYYYTYAIFKDEKHIIASRFNNLNDRHCEIVEINTVTKKLKNITTCAKRAVTHLAFDNTTQKLYFNYRDSVSHPYSIKSIQLNTRRTQQITHVNPEGNARGDYLFSLSPSNNMAVFEYQEDGQSMLKIVPLSSPHNVKRTTAFSGVSGVSWFNENNVLVSHEDTISVFNLSSNKSTVILEEKNITQAIYTPLLSLLSYVKFDRQANIYQLDISKNHKQDLTPITHSSFVNLLPNYANTSNSFTYLSTDSGKYSIYLNTGKNNVNNLNFPEDIKHISNLKWAQDDSFILASVNAKLFKYIIESQAWFEIKTKITNIHYVDIIDESNALVSSDVNGDWQLWKVNTLTGNANQVTTKGGYSAHYNAKNKKVLLSKFSQPGLFELDLKSSTETMIEKDFKITDWNKWQTVGNNLYYWKDNAIIKRNLKTNTTAVIKEFIKKNTFYFHVNFNETNIAYRVTEQEKSGIWQAKISVE